MSSLKEGLSQALGKGLKKAFSPYAVVRVEKLEPKADVKEVTELLNQVLLDEGYNTLVDNKKVDGAIYIARRK